MKNWKSDLNHTGSGVVLFCILLLVTFARAEGAQPAELTAQDRPTLAATPPDQIAVALKEIPVWEVANERVRSSFLRGEPGSDGPSGVTKHERP